MTQNLIDIDYVLNAGLSCVISLSQQNQSTIRNPMTPLQIFGTLPAKFKNFGGDDELRHDFNKLMEFLEPFPKAVIKDRKLKHDAIQFCQSSFNNDFIWVWDAFYFKHERDVTLFVLQFEVE